MPAGRRYDDRQGPPKGGPSGVPAATERRAMDREERGNEMTAPIRGQSAIVGVADAVSPTGNLDITGRALEVAMIKEALDDAGLRISDVDAVFAANDAMGLAEFIGVQPRWLD